MYKQSSTIQTKISQRKLPQSQHAVDSFKPGGSWHGDLFLDLITFSDFEPAECNAIVDRSHPPPLTLQ